uniref:Uncharacterized protein n=1 Tax=Chromera velia CCMP2878 TaxID=1169474 RepID=A0A0G4HVN2_9ALVE|eukprot:Cvel_1420.t1-p1 / transcript=Cvel_1420.t1 / gene=Cvel_1420 / organism=Chromera_velia_CCMP2878 / gene_product=hypothetical protein / transcript_product=hypothetical protein / location=Cvel_scaffold49:131471-132088(+) / protein_length=206 / sequence_SO=supercontig / SO=protein_coding / is_pseudo=false
MSSFACCLELSGGRRVLWGGLFLRVAEVSLLSCSIGLYGFPAERAEDLSLVVVIMSAASICTAVACAYYSMSALCDWGVGTPKSIEERHKRLAAVWRSVSHLYTFLLLLHCSLFGLLIAWLILREDTRETPLFVFLPSIATPVLILSDLGLVVLPLGIASGLERGEFGRDARGRSSSLRRQVKPDREGGRDGEAPGVALGHAGRES